MKKGKIERRGEGRSTAKDKCRERGSRTKRKARTKNNKKTIDDTLNWVEKTKIQSKQTQMAIIFHVDVASLGSRRRLVHLCNVNVFILVNDALHVNKNPV